MKISHGYKAVMWRAGNTLVVRVMVGMCLKLLNFAFKMSWWIFMLHVFYHQKKKPKKQTNKQNPSNSSMNINDHEPDIVFACRWWSPGSSSEWELSGVEAFGWVAQGREKLGGKASCGCGGSQLGQGLWECAHVWGIPSYLQCSDVLHP